MLLFAHVILICLVHVNIFNVMYNNIKIYYCIRVLYKLLYAVLIKYTIHI